MSISYVSNLRISLLKSFSVK